MYKYHRDFITPKDSVIVWHYFSLSKFIGLLESSKLYFSRQDQFDDSGEGRLSQSDKVFLSKYGSIAEHIESDEVGCYYANCWTASKSDEYVLWHTYASLTDGIAIKSTVGRIKKALDANDERGVYIAKVKYIDETKGSTFSVSGGLVNVLSLAFSKRKYFNAEKELRLLYHDDDARLNDESPVGVLFHVDLTDLIDSIYVAPKAYPWFENAIAHMLKLYGLGHIVINKSRI